MKKKMVAVFMAASFSAIGCIADAVEGSMEEVASTKEEMVRRPVNPEVVGPIHWPVDLMGIGAMKREPALEIPEIPKWKAYIGAPKGRHARYGVSTRPDTVDERANIVLIRNDGRPEARIPLFLRQSWRYGDRYFERLAIDLKLTPLDWIGILMAIENLEEHPVLVPEPAPYDRIPADAVYEGPTGPTVPPLPPLPGDDHQGPWPRGGGRGSGPTSGVTGPNHPPPPQPDYSWPPPLPRVPPGGEHLARNGIFPGDLKNGWIPPGRPEDKGYKPLPGEEMEIIRCEGRIVTAYKNNCIDFKSMTIGAKWTSKVSAFFQGEKQDFQAYVFQNFWSGGKKPQCTKSCQWVSNAGCFGELGAGLLICSGLTGGACLTAIPAVIATASAGGAAVATCIDQIRNYCDENICIN